MAGYAMGFEDGGAIPEDDSGFGPVDAAPAAAAPDQSQDNSGMGPVDAPQAGAIPEEPQRGRSGMRAPHEALRDASKSILSYLMGADAAPPQAAQKFVAGVKAEHPGVSDDDANVIAVHKAFELGGPDAAWQMVQFNRTAYNAKQSFALAALLGSDQKPSDVQAAAQAATQASQHVLDGSRASFVASPDGNVTATVNLPGSGRGINYKLNPKQFARWLNVGQDGQWDKVMENGGVPGTLSRLAAKAGGTDAAANGGSVAENYDDDDQPGQPEVVQRTGTNFGKTPSTLDLSNGERGSYVDPHTINPDLQERANQLFPSVSQQAQRNAYIAQQMDQASAGRRGIRKAEVEGANKRDIAAITGGSRVQSAQARAEGTEHAAQSRADASRYSADQRANVGHEANATRKDVANQSSADRAATRAQNERMGVLRENGRNYRSDSANPISALRKPEEQQQMRDQYGVKTPGREAPQGNSNASPAPSGGGRSFTGANVPPAAQRQQGDTVTTDKGTFRWTGSGWQKQ